MSLFKSRVVAVVAATAVIGAATTTGAVAAKMITGDDIKNGTITTKDVKNNSLKSSDIKNGSLAYKDLNDKAKNKLAGQDGADGQDGVALSANLASDPVTIENLGGKFADRATMVGTIELPEAGTYVVNSYAFFDTKSAASPRTDGTHLELALRGPVTEENQWGLDAGTCFTGAFPQGDRELTCQSVRTITVDEATTLTVSGFGYNDDTSATGSGEFTVAADVSALKVGVAAN